MFFTIGQAAAMIGITPKTLRIWEKQGKIEPAQRTIGGHRRYTYADIKKIMEGDPIAPDDRIVVGYARVSAHDQKADLSLIFRIMRSIDTLKTTPPAGHPSTEGNFFRGTSEKENHLYAYIQGILNTHNSPLWRGGAQRRGGSALSYTTIKTAIPRKIRSV